MQVDKLKRWRWILLYTAVLSAVVAVSVTYLLDIDIISDVLGILSFASAIVLGVFIFIKRSTITSKFKTALFLLFSIAVVLWFFHYMPFPSSEFFKDLEWVFYDVGLVLGVGIPILLLFSYFEKTTYLIPLIIPAIIVGLVLKRFGIVDESEYLVFYGFFMISVCLLKEAISSLRLFRKKLLQKSLFFFVGLFLGLCTSTIFFQYSAYEIDSWGIFDLIQSIVFLLAALFLLIAMPFSGYLEWPVKLKRHFTRIILIPSVFLFILISMRFVLPQETYRKIFFKEHAEAQIHFRMEEYDLKDQDKKGGF